MPPADARPHRGSLRTALALPREPVRLVVRRAANLTAAERDDVWTLTSRYVETERADYERKLVKGSEVGLFRTRSDRLVGVVTLDAFDVTWGGRRRRVLFSYNVVVDEPYRKRQLPLRLGLRTWVRERLRHPFTPIDWLFDTFSYKSYVLLPRNMTEYWPRRDRATPPSVAAYIDHLAGPLYGDAWRPERGVAAARGKRLRPDTAPVGESQRADPDVRFFAEANPGHAEGDCLVCLAPLTLANFAEVLRRAVRQRRAIRARARGLRSSGAFAVRR